MIQITGPSYDAESKDLFPHFVKHRNRQWLIYGIMFFMSTKFCSLSVLTKCPSFLGKTLEGLDSFLSSWVCSSLEEYHPHTPLLKKLWPFIDQPNCRKCEPALVYLSTNLANSGLFLFILSVAVLVTAIICFYVFTSGQNSWLDACYRVPTVTTRHISQSFSYYSSIFLLFCSSQQSLSFCVFFLQVQKSILMLHMKLIPWIPRFRVLFLERRV